VPRIGRKPKGAYHHGNLRSAIVAAADRVVADDGSRELTIRKVADRLGVTHAAIYHHFADRTTMLAAVAEEAFGRLADSLANSATASPIETFRAIGVAYVAFALEHPHVYEAMFGEELVPRDRFVGLASARARVFDQIRTAIEACQREGFIKPGSPHEHTLFCWSSVHGFAALVRAGQTAELELPSDRTALADIVIDRIFLGLANTVPIGAASP
jgi:AcrR family transcriptional regulator